MGIIVRGSFSAALFYSKEIVSYTQNSKRLQIMTLG